MFGVRPLAQPQQPAALPVTGNSCLDRISKIALAILTSLASFLFLPPVMALAVSGTALVLACSSCSSGNIPSRVWNAASSGFSPRPRAREHEEVDPVYRSQIPAVLTQTVRPGLVFVPTAQTQVRMSPSIESPLSDRSRSPHPMEHEEVDHSPVSNRTNQASRGGRSTRSIRGGSIRGGQGVLLNPTSEASMGRGLFSRAESRENSVERSTFLPQWGHLRPLSGEREETHQ